MFTAAAKYLNDSHSSQLVHASEQKCLLQQLFVVVATYSARRGPIGLPGVMLSEV